MTPPRSGQHFRHLRWARGLSLWLRSWLGLAGFLRPQIETSRTTAAKLSLLVERFFNVGRAVLGLITTRHY